MKIVSWNVAGLRARLKNDEKYNNNLTRLLFSHINNNGDCNYYDIVCLQETKCCENEVTLPAEISIRYPYRYWNSTDGTSQRKGFSGTSIWSSEEPISNLGHPEFDNEGRIVTLEFEKFILVNVYVPNSQKFENDRYYFRESWNNKFINYIKELREKKEVIICGDMNVAHNPIDISNPKSKKNKIAGFFDIERAAFDNLLNTNELLDVFRIKNPDKQESTYWSNFLKSPRSDLNGWRIDYFLVNKNLYDELCVKDIVIHKDVVGSDHCPVMLEIE